MELCMYLSWADVKIKNEAGNTGAMSLPDKGTLALKTELFAYKNLWNIDKEIYVWFDFIYKIWFHI